MPEVCTCERPYRKDDPPATWLLTRVVLGPDLQKNWSMDFIFEKMVRASELKNKFKIFFVKDFGQGKVKRAIIITNI